MEENKQLELMLERIRSDILQIEEYEDAYTKKLLLPQLKKLENSLVFLVEPWNY